jgi:GTPase SAR1 family protein
MAKSCIFKIIMAGASGSGKTTFLNGAYIPFNDDEFYQIGVSFKLVDCLINSEDSCLLQIWDFKANSTLKSLYPSFCKGAKGSFLCFDLTDRVSFNKLDYWIKIIRKMAGSIPIILIATKSDLNCRAILDEEINDIVDKFQLTGVYYTSINNINREQIFKQLLEKMDHFSNIFQLSILLPDNDYDFESFMKIFSVCPICKRKNHYNYLKRFYFSKNYEMLKIKDGLLKLMDQSREFDDFYYNKISIGIPCCKCFKHYKLVEKN